jgi:aromatic ring-opening dioxygenase LigB subunit
MISQQEACMSIVAAIAVPHPPLLIPGVGDNQKAKVAQTKTAFEQAAAFVVSAAPQTLIIISPHAPLYRDCFHISRGSMGEGDFSQFVARDSPHYSAIYDSTLLESIFDALQNTCIPVAHADSHDYVLDHGTMLPLHFLQQAYAQEKTALPQIVRIGLSGLALNAHWQLGRCLSFASDAACRRIAIIASGDLSHYLRVDGPYGYREEGAVFDQAICELLAAGDFSRLLRLDEELCDKAGECGLRSLVILGGATEALSFVPQLLSYEGPFGVGYAVATFTIRG